VAGLTLDAGALIAYERADPRVRGILARAFARGVVPTVPAMALAEVWRGDAKDARLARLLKACTVEPVTESLARSTGELRRRTRGSETIDASIAVGVRHRRDAVMTSDPDDMRRLLGPAFIILAV
jgi:predicted nucleic acid-binding protein